MITTTNGHNQQQIEKGFSALFHHQLCFCSLNEQMQQTERVELQQCAVEQCCIEIEVKETEGGGHYRAWCNYLYKLDKRGK